ncbi:MAG: GNAT family N-acetyltransferase [Thermoplasmata archaeon]
MKIVHYHDLDDIQMTELTLACFHHTYSKEHVKKMVEADKRIPDWGGELYAVDGDVVLGTVGLLYPRINTEEDLEIVGGIRNVCTRPSASRKGVARRLMEEAHKRMKEKGVRYSFLMTSKSLVAYDLYVKLGYRDIHRFPAAFKKTEKKSTEVKFEDEVEPDCVRSLYKESVENLQGLIVREDDYWGMAKARGWPDTSQLKTAYQDGEKIGYAMFNKRRKQMDCVELVAEVEENLTVLIQALESRAQGRDLAFYHVTPYLKSVLTKRGCHHYNDTWGRIMVKEWKEKLPLDEDLFHCGIFETF